MKRKTEIQSLESRGEEARNGKTPLYQKRKQTHLNVEKKKNNKHRERFKAYITKLKEQKQKNPEHTEVMLGEEM